MGGAAVPASPAGQPVPRAPLRDSGPFSAASPEQHGTAPTVRPAQVVGTDAGPTTRSGAGRVKSAEREGGRVGQRHDLPPQDRGRCRRERRNRDVKAGPDRANRSSDPRDAGELGIRTHNSWVPRRPASPFDPHLRRSPRAGPLTREATRTNRALAKSLRRSVMIVTPSGSRHPWPVGAPSAYKLRPRPRRRFSAAAIGFAVRPEGVGSGVGPQGSGARFFRIHGRPEPVEMSSRGRGKDGRTHSNGCRCSCRRRACLTSRRFVPPPGQVQPRARACVPLGG